MDSSFSVQNIIRLSWLKTKEFLLPFEFKRWLKVLLIVWLAGHSASFGGWNFGKPFKKAPPITTENIQIPAKPKTFPTAPSKANVNLTQKDQTIQPGSPAKVLDQTNAPADQSVVKELQPPEPQKKRSISFPVLAVYLTGGFIILMISFAIFFVWLTARFNFVYLELLVQRAAALKEGFFKYRVLGNSYFGWLVCFLGISMVAIGLPFLILFFVAGKLSFVVLIIAETVLVLVIASIATLMMDFVLPIMYRDQVSAMEGCRKFLSSTPGWSSLLKYLLIKLGLGFVALTTLLLVASVIGILAALLALLIFVPIVFLYKALAAFQLILNIIVVLLAIVFVFFVVLSFALATLPIPVFFRNFELIYLAYLIPEYNLLNVSGIGAEIRT